MTKANYHTHTSRCHHATGSDEDYVRSAIKGGYEILGFSDHTPWPYASGFVSRTRMLPSEMEGYVQSLRSLKEQYEGKLDIKIGLECEYYPAMHSWLSELKEAFGLDYLIFGNHHYPLWPVQTSNNAVRSLLEGYQNWCTRKGMAPRLITTSKTCKGFSYESSRNSLYTRSTSSLHQGCLILHLYLFKLRFLVILLCFHNP